MFIPTNLQVLQLSPVKKCKFPSCKYMRF